ncbi:uncharacterized protein I303_103471 [Kwoniella dejecticola CBS 10117]|uniref:Uncharacterized protein n=1 Tax=Kwoniella dejecticola CBS 10117 TaxID=1296121 RepID=A0A1A6A6U1_9TREE|nr:uncharacterized protein I303_03493 [Kwoniella dejecticola CBS 10117]OBR85781.1 hypothetical protein I303_03493 [Kwoniella dejecticola CBS 10117]
MSINRNITIDDPSPLITYVGNWDGGDHDGDPFVGQYSNSTFHSSYTTGDVAKFDFEGNAIWLFGAFRPNHGYYSVSIDGAEKTYNNGNKTDDVFVQVLYSLRNLQQGKHELVLTNEKGYNGSDARNGYGWLDLDFIMYQTSSSSSSPSSGTGLAQYNDSMVITTGTPRVQLHFPSGTPHPIEISAAKAVRSMNVLTLFCAVMITLLRSARNLG